MKNWIILYAVLTTAVPLFGQALSGIPGNCELGGQQVLTSGLPSTGTQQIGTTNVNAGAGVQASFPSCLVSVYITRTTTKANLYSDNSNSPQVLSNPFIANPDGSFTAFVAAGCYDIVMSSGAGPALPYTRTLTGECYGQGTIVVPGGSGTVGSCGNPGGIGFYQVAGTTITCDQRSTTNGAGSWNIISMTLSGPGAGFLGFTQGTAPSLAASNTAYLASPASVPTSFLTLLPSTPPASVGCLQGTNSGGVVTLNYSNSGCLAPPGAVLLAPGADQTLTGAFNLINNGGAMRASNTSATPSDSTLDVLVTSAGRGDLLFTSPTNSLVSNIFFNPATGAIVLQPPSGGAPDDTAHGVIIGNGGLYIPGQFTDGVALLIGAGNAVINGAGGSSAALTLGSTGVEGIFVTEPPSGGGSYTIRSPITGLNNSINWPNGSGTLGFSDGSLVASATQTVQQTMTLASTNGLSKVPSIYSGTDIPTGTRLNSRNTPTSSLQSLGARLQDFRFGDYADSCFNPGQDGGGLQIWYCESLISWWTKNLGNASNGGTNNVNALTIQNNILSGSQNINQNGYTNKSDFAGLEMDVNSWSPVEGEAFKVYQNGYSTGDKAGAFFTSADYGGCHSGSDECLEAMDINLYEGADESLGTATGSPSSGATSLTLTFTQTPGHVGVDREIGDTTQAVTTGTVTSMVGTGMVTVTFAGVSIPVSTNTTTTSGVAVPGGSTTPGAVSIPVVNSAGFLGQVFCIADVNGSRECANVSSIPDGTHINATLIYPYASGATVCTGGRCGWGLDFVDDDWTSSASVGFLAATPPLRQVWFVVGSTATTETIQIVVAGTGNPYYGHAAIPGAAYKNFPMSIITDVTNGTGTLSSTLTVMPNTMVVSNGDTLAVFDGPSNGHTGLGNWHMAGFHDSPPFKPYTSGLNYDGMGMTNNDIGFQVNNNGPFTEYTGHGGRSTVPSALYAASGLANVGLNFTVTPDRAIIQSGCRVNSSGVQACGGTSQPVLWQPKASDGLSHQFGWDSTNNLWEFITSSNVDIAFGAAAGRGVQLENAGQVIESPLYQTLTKCAASGTAANPSVVACAASAAGIVYCDVAASAGTCTINTTAVTTNSSITITPSTADGTLLSKTCNTSPSAMPPILLAAKVNGTSFTLNMPTGVTNGFCFEYSVIN